MGKRIIPLILAGCIFFGGCALLAYPKVKFEGIAGCLFAALAIPMCLSSIVRIIVGELGRHYVLVPIMIPFIADAGAYFAGKFLGKHKMAPVLSPHKTSRAPLAVWPPVCFPW